MNKRNLLLGGLLAVSVTASVCGLVACGDSEPPKEEVPVITETVRYTDKTNPYAEVTWQEIKTIDDWADKQENAPIYYQFEGSYSEAYQGDYSRTFLYMNCYEDGSLHATYGSDNYYGYWTNVDKRGKETLVLHILRFNDGEYNSGIYESVCDSKSDEYYEYASTVVWAPSWGTRTVMINGYHYSPVKSITVTPSAESSGCIMGDKMNYNGLVVTINRENGKSINIDEQSYGKSDCRVQFSGFDSSEAGDNEITVKYIYTDVSTTYIVKIMGVKSIALDVDSAVKDFKVDDDFTTEGLVVKATRDDNVVVDLDLGKCEVVKPEDWGTPGEKTVTVRFQELEAKTYKVNIEEAVYNGTVNGKDATITLKNLTECEYNYDGNKYTLNYSLMKDKYGDIVKEGAYQLSKPADGEISDDILNAVRTVTMDKAASTFAKALIYKIPDNGDGNPGDERYENEIYDPGGGSEVRYLMIDEEAETATISYKYWYHGSKDTYVCKYTIEDGVLTLTEEISNQLGWGGSSFEKIHKVWKLNDDGTATRDPLRQ